MTYNNFVFICRDKMSYLELTEKRKELASFVNLDNCYNDMDDPLDFFRNTIKSAIDIYYL